MLLECVDPTVKRRIIACTRVSLKEVGSNFIGLFNLRLESLPHNLLHAGIKTIRRLFDRGNPCGGMCDRRRVQPHWLATGTAASEAKASTRGAVRILTVLAKARKLVGTAVGCRTVGLKAARPAGTDTMCRPDGLKVTGPAGTNTTSRTVCTQKWTTIVRTDLFVR